MQVIVDVDNDIFCKCVQVFSQRMGSENGVKYEVELIESNVSTLRKF